MSMDFKQFKETSPNRKITLCLSERYLLQGESVDGVILVDEDCMVEGRKITAKFHGRIRVADVAQVYKATIFSFIEQLWPRSETQRLTEFQDTLMRKLGPNAIPFTFSVPTGLPSSLIIYSPHHDKLNGVSYSIEVHCGEILSDSVDKESTVCMELGIINVELGGGHQPAATVCKPSTFGRGVVKLEVTLDKGTFFVGEEISVNLSFRNNSRTKVKKVKAWIQQDLHIPLTCTSRYTSHIIDSVKIENTRLNAKMVLGLKLTSGAKDGFAVNGPLGDGTMELASTTPDDCSDLRRIDVTYNVVVKIYLGGLFGGTLRARLPFIVGISEFETALTN